MKAPRWGEKRDTDKTAPIFYQIYLTRGSVSPRRAPDRRERELDPDGLPPFGLPRSALAPLGQWPTRALARDGRTEGSVARTA